MKIRAVGLAVILAGFAVVSAQEAPQAPPARRGGGPPPGQMVWAPKGIKLNEWVPPHKPHTKLVDVLAKHKGHADWTEVIVDDDTLHAAYIAMAPGNKTPRRMNADTREWWVVQDGQIRFTIDGQQPFVASKGYLVQVPYRTMYEMETVGDRPSLRYEVNIAKARKMYPMDVKPDAAAPDSTFVPVRVPGQRHLHRRQ